MAVSIEQAWSFAQRCEKGLLAELHGKEPTFRDIEDLITQLRSACENVILKDFDFTTENKVEVRLWDAHGKINNRFRKLLSHMRGKEGRNKVVEKRKLEKHYMGFIKSSQKFYRGYIHRLALQYDGVPELEAVAKRFSLNILSADNQVPTSDTTKHAILLSCYHTLIRLGDLSRYRETELTSKNRNWAAAIGYYDLAEAIYPFDGISHNQRAVIAIADGNHLRTTYHLYRALAVEHPPPTGKRNIELEFKKITTAWEKGEPITNSTGPGKALVQWFIRLHAKCYKGVEFPEHDELENEVLSQLAVDLKERSLEGTLSKITLINLAAEYYALIRLQDNPADDTPLEAFWYFQRLNVKTFFTLLRILQTELEQFAADDSNTNGTPDDSTPNGSEKITAVIRRVLPAIRHYSSWLISTVDFLTSNVRGETGLQVQIKEMWNIYANTLNLITTTFPIHDFPAIEYLFDEDADTIGFKPFRNGKTASRFLTEEKKVKPRYCDHGIQRSHPNVEMLGRFRDLLADGLKLATGRIELANNQTAPIFLDNGRFVYREEGVPALSSPDPKQANLSQTSVDREDISMVNGDRATHNNPSLVEEGASQSESTSISMNPTMNQMVDSLVDSEVPDFPTDDQATAFALPPCPPTPIARPCTADYKLSPMVGTSNDTYGAIGTPKVPTVKDYVDVIQSGSYRAHLSSHTPRPSIPSIINSPFALQPDECSPQLRPATAKKTTPQNRFSFGVEQSSMLDPSTLMQQYGPYVNQSPGRQSTIYEGGSVFEGSFNPLTTPYSYGGYADLYRSTPMQAPPNGQG
ncbi:MAG: hypothetical protein M1834_009058 [Cirrosporium novae-zelandiae]|nr:MAG: hypothetical protein M1834_009058 [Cirrosporium novae-zelandiae]